MNESSSNFVATKGSFENLFDSEYQEIGASFVVYLKGEKILSLSGGKTLVDDNDWHEDNLAAIYSSGKSIISLLILKAISENKLDVEKKIIEYWPSFANKDSEKANISVKDVLEHKSGFMAFAHPFPSENWIQWDKIIYEVETQDPPAKLHEFQGYSPQIYGLILARILEIVYHDKFQNIVANYAKQINASIKCGLADEDFKKIVKMKLPPKAPDLGEMNEYKKLAFLEKHSSPAKVGFKDWAKAIIPASNMFASADGLAKSVHPICNDGYLEGKKILDFDVKNIFQRKNCVFDKILPFNLFFSYGLMGNCNNNFGCNQNNLGHSGFGGSAVMLDNDNNISAAFVMNKMSEKLLCDPRSSELFKKIYEDLQIK